MSKTYIGVVCVVILFWFFFILMLHFLVSYAKLLFFPELLLDFPQHPLNIFQPFLLSLSLRNPPVMMSFLCFYLQIYLSHKWVFLKLVALLHLCSFENLPLAFVLHMFVACYCCCFCSLWCCYLESYWPLRSNADPFIRLRGDVTISPWIFLWPMTWFMDPRVVYSWTVVLA